MKKIYLNLSFNSSEFHSIALKFKNLSNRIDALLNTGKFWEISKAQQQSLLSRLRSLFEKLKGFDPKYAMKIAGAAMCFTLISGAAKALPTFDEFSNPVNPFTFSTILGNSFSPLSIYDGAFADIDGDGDDDAILWTWSGPAFFENINGQFIENTDPDDNPFKYGYCCGTNVYYNYPYATGIDMADFDGDGDLDAILIISCQSLVHYQMVSGKFEEVSGSDINMNHGSAFFYGCQVKFSDVDGDGDLDIVGTYCSAGTFIGTLLQQSNHTFNDITNYPVSGSISILSPYSIKIDFADMDGDGDDDLFVFNICAPASPGLNAPSSAQSFINYFENTPGSGVFNRVTSGIPLPPDLSSSFVPFLADLDGDGDVDVFIPGNGGASNYQNISAPPVPISPLVALIAIAATGFGIFRRNRKKKTE